MRFMGVDWINLAQDRDQCNEPWSSIKCQEFIGQLAYCQLLKKDCAAGSWLKTSFRYGCVYGVVIQ
jgi:hypothetical protein